MPRPFAAIDRLMQAQRWDAAITALDALPAPLRGEPSALRYRRMAFAIGGHLSKALEAAELLVAQPGTDADSTADLQNLAHIRLRVGQPGDAFTAAEVAIGRDPVLMRACAVAVTAAVLDPRLIPRLRALLGPVPDDEPDTGPSSSNPRLRVAIPWRLPAYRPYSGPHPVITSALGRGSRVEARWADPMAALEPARAIALLPELIAWAERTSPARLAALADFLVHRLPATFFALPAADVTFHHTVPFGLDGRPWVFHLEHLNMAAAPMVTYPTAVLHAHDAQATLLRDRLGDPSCIGVFTHIRETKRRLIRLLDDPALAAKISHIRLGIDLDGSTRPSDHAASRLAAPMVRRPMTTLLFTNSLARDNFHVRGGPDVLSAFLHLADQRDDIRLLMRSDLPSVGAEGLVRRARRHPRITWIRERLSDAEIGALYRAADLFLLPSGLLHAVSIVRALRGGLALVASDVYGVDEFVRHRINGWIVPGRRTAVTPQGAEDAVYAEDCRSLLDPTAEPPDPRFQRRFRAAIRRLLDNPGLTAALRRNARHGAAHDHQGHRWAMEVSAFMERAMERAMGPDR